MTSGLPESHLKQTPGLVPLLPQPIRLALSHLYRLVVSTRMGLYKTGYLKARKVPKPVISVGNLTLGGTGKTPLVEYIGRVLQAMGYRIAVISRGYGRKTSRPLLVSDGSRLWHADPTLTGDEPLLLAQHLPNAVVAVGADRYKTIQLVEASSPRDVYLLDDAFQHLQIHRSADIVLVDATNPFGSFAFPPQGTLREPIEGLARATAIVITRADRCFDQFHLEQVIRSVAPSVPVFYSYHEITHVYNPITGEHFPPQKLAGHNVVAVCSIGNPQIFLQDLSHYQAHVSRFYSFRDHYRFRPDDLLRLLAETKASHSEMIVTTEKDWMRIRPVLPSSCPPSFYVARIEARLDDDLRFQKLLLAHIHQDKQPSERATR